MKSGGNEVDGSLMMPASIQYCTLPSGEVGMFIPQVFRFHSYVLYRQTDSIITLTVDTISLFNEVIQN